MYPKSAWKKCPSGVNSKLSRCRSPTPRRYVTTQYPAKGQEFQMAAGRTTRTDVRFHDFLFNPAFGSVGRIVCSEVTQNTSALGNCSIEAYGVDKLDCSMIN